MTRWFVSCIDTKSSGALRDGQITSLYRNLIKPFREKYSTSVFQKYVFLCAHPARQEGASADRHETWGGMRWTRRRAGRGVSPADGEIVWS
jgi:hypothetical protein